MSIQMPETPEEMLRLPGVTKANFEKYGQKLLAITVKCSAEKFCILSEHDDQIEEFESQSHPGTSKGPQKSTNRAEEDAWIDMRSQTSTYFPRSRAAPTRKRKVTRKKRKGSPKKKSPVKRNTTSTLSKYRKSLNKNPSLSPFKNSSRSTGGGSMATTAAKKSTIASSGGGGLRLMPMPKPAQRNLNL